MYRKFSLITTTSPSSDTLYFSKWLSCTVSTSPPECFFFWVLAHAHRSSSFHQPGSEAELELECLSYSSVAAVRTHKVFVSKGQHNGAAIWQPLNYPLRSDIRKVTPYLQMVGLATFMPRHTVPSAMVSLNKYLGYLTQGSKSHQLQKLHKSILTYYIIHIVF